MKITIHDAMSLYQCLLPHAANNYELGRALVNLSKFIANHTENLELDEPITDQTNSSDTSPF